jgi:hypothetical protein
MAQTEIRKQLEALLASYRGMVEDLDRFCGDAPIEAWGRREEERLAERLAAARSQGGELARLIGQAITAPLPAPELRQLQTSVAAAMQQVLERTRILEARMQSAIDFRQRAVHPDLVAQRMRAAYRPAVAVMRSAVAAE